VGEIKFEGNSTTTENAEDLELADNSAGKHVGTLLAIFIAFLFV
jgi:hypothetical protein